jgi:hypothetical protein
MRRRIWLGLVAVVVLAPVAIPANSPASASLAYTCSADSTLTSGAVTNGYDARNACDGSSWSSWTSDAVPSSEVRPHWLLMRWAAPQKLASVQIRTGKLARSVDFFVEVSTPTGFRRVAVVAGNDQPSVVVKFRSVVTRELRIVFTKSVASERTGLPAVPSYATVADVRA